VRILVLSFYELGHQPLDAATAAAALHSAGHEVRVRDLAVEPWADDHVTWADGVACSIPMHTARRLAAAALPRLRAKRPELPVCWYGLYAVAGPNDGRGPVHLVAGEFEPALVAWADALHADSGTTGSVRALDRRVIPLPRRSEVPPLDHYARLAVQGAERPAAAIQTTRGCAHRCRHCPVPVVYGGRTRVVERDVVLADAEQAIHAGARHLTLADPDFFNRPRHAVEIVRELHAAFPDVTFDCTVKVEHILRHAERWPELADAGCLFVVSAFESVDDRTLALLAKGHTGRDATTAARLLRSNGIDLRPSWLPFLPWTSLDHVVSLLDFVADHDLVATTDPVQYSIRLLVPPESLLLELPEVRNRLEGFDDAAHTWTWRAADPAVDVLQREVAATVERGTAAGASVGDIYRSIRALVFAASGERDTRSFDDGSFAGAGERPHLTEAWFCCAEPTGAQFEVVDAR